MSLRILGAGGHAKVVVEAWRSAAGNVVALHDDNPELHGRLLLGLQVVGPLEEGVASGAPLHIAIGDNQARLRVAAGLADDRFPKVVHAIAQVSPSAAIAAGSLVCAGAVIQAEARVGRHVIINSLALIEHDVEVGDFCHVAPGVRVGGGARIGAAALIGIGAVVLPGVEVGEGAVVGAGAIVIHDVPGLTVVAGNPASLLRR